MPTCFTNADENRAMPTEMTTSQPADGLDVPDPFRGLQVAAPPRIGVAGSASEHRDTCLQHERAVHASGI